MSKLEWYFCTYELFFDVIDNPVGLVVVLDMSIYFLYTA